MLVRLSFKGFDPERGAGIGALVGHSQYIINRDIGGLGDLEGFGSFLKKVGQATVNVGRIALVPVTGGASLLIPKATFADKPTAVAPPPDPNASSFMGGNAVAEAIAARASAASGTPYESPTGPRSYAPASQSQIVPLSAGQYLVPPNYLNPPLTLPASSGLPGWLMPAGLAAGGLLVTYLLLKKKPS